jgi:ABC-2 type transport system permease protein
VHDRNAAIPTARPVWAVVVRSFAFLRKEVVEIVRQPRLIALLVVGPFALLVMFGTGYSETSIVKRAIFVGPPDSIYQEVLDGYQDQLSDFIDSKGMVATEAEGRAALANGDVDVVVVFPEDPEESVMRGERAVIRVLHDEIDPIQEGAVEVAARLAIQEVNATVLATLAADAQSELTSADELGRRLSTLAAGLDADPVATGSELHDELGRVGAALDGTSTVLARLQPGDPELLDEIARTRTATTELADRVEAIDEGTSDAELRDIGGSIDAVVRQLGQVVVLDPDVLVRPFASDTDNVLATSISPTDYFTPASLALLLQHLALTFAALSLVRDRRTGLFELMRVGPLSSIEIIIGKIFAYLLVGAVVGGALVAAAVFGLGVPLVGSVGLLAVFVVGVLLASLALGMVLAIVSRTESQAVQYAMLVLLAGLFFSGFILPIDGLSYPVRVVSWLLPVTYGIRSMQDIMLRGVTPATSVWIGLGALVVGYGLVAVLGLRRRLRTGSGS